MNCRSSFFARVAALVHLLAFLMPFVASGGIHDVRSHYSFSGNLNSRWSFQTGLSPVSFSASYATSTIAGGVTSQVLNVPALTPAQGLTFTNWAAANGGAGINGGSTATRTNRWTMVMDIAPTTVGGTTWSALLQSNVTNADDAEIFIRNDGSLYANGTVAPPGTVTFGQWQRLAFVCDNNGNGGALTLTMYRNGTPVGSVGGLEFDGRFSLPSQFFLFSDDNSETTPSQINALCFWTEPRTAAEIAAMGGPSGVNPEIQWPSMPAPTALPGLTGQFYFGPYALNLPAAGFQLGNGVVSLGSGATVAGATSYALTGIHAFRLGSGGSLEYTGSGTSIPAGAFVRINNVLLHPGTITLSSSGAVASNMRVHLPIGLCVGEVPSGLVTPWSRRMVDQAVLGSRNLASGLYPTNGAVGLLPSHFGLSSSKLALALESRPVRYLVSEITWAPSTGAFLIPATTEVGFDRLYERGALVFWNVTPGVIGDPRPSNDDVFAFASGLGNTIVDTNANGMAVIREGVQNFTNTTDGYVAHYPFVRVRWTSATGSKIRHLAGALQEDSQLTDGMNEGFLLGRDPADTGCGELAGQKVLNIDPTGDWKFTRDGGLHASVTVTGTTAQRTVEWGATGSSTFAHKIDTPLTAGAVMIPGNSLPASQLPGVPITDRPAALLLSGNGNGSAPETTIERPGSAPYFTGAADYAGLNVRISANNSHTATSRLAGTPVSYPLRSTSKYVLKQSGITGVHDAVAQTVPPGQSYPINTVLAGYAVGLSDIRLSFLDSNNVQSGVNGAFNIPAPAALPNLAVHKLRFGPRGELLDATFVLPGEMTLNYWGCKITPHAMSFARPAGTCPPADQASLVLGVSVKLPALSDETFSGNIGFKPNGHTVTPADNIVLGDGQKVTSRLRPPNEMSLKGPGSLSYPFTPTIRGAWLNEYTASPPPGFVALPGEMNVPFFKDLKVLVNARSSAIASPTSSISVFAGDANGFDFFNGADPDTNNFGVKAGLPGPNARRKLWDLIDLDLPLTWNNNLRRFEGKDAVHKDLMLFKLDQKCSTLGPQVAEINFGASASVSAKSISAATLLDALGADSKNLLGNITGPASGLLNDALSSLKLTDDLGEAALEKLFAPSLGSVSESVGEALYDSLKANYDSAASLTAYKNNGANNTLFSNAVGGMTGQIGALPTGAWRTEIQNRLNSAITVCQRLESIAQNSSYILSIAESIRVSSGGGNAPSVSGLTDTLADLNDSLVTLRTQLQEIRSGFDANPLGSTPKYGALLQASLGNVTGWVNSAIDPLKADWISQIPDPVGSGYFTPARKQVFVAQFKQRVRNAFLGSVTEQNLRQVVAEITGDPLNRLRNGFDGIVATANTAIQSANPLPNPAVATLGSFSSVFSGAKMTGYARINGESLKELRLDGELTLKVPDDMVIKAWFVMRDVDGSMPGDKALAAGGVKTEVTVGAGAPLTFLGQADAYAAAELRVGIGDSGPISVAGSLDITGNIDFQSIRVSQIHFAVAIGPVDCYVAAKVAGELDTGYFIIGAEVAVFLGKTSRTEPIEKINPNVVKLIGGLGLGTTVDSTQVLYGAYVYAYGDFSVLSLIGIPPSCLLDIRLGGGQGNYIFYREGAGAVAGMQFTHAIRGRALCLVNVGGGIDGYIAGAYSTAGQKKASFANLRAAGRLNAVLSGKIGISPFSYTWKKNFGFDVSINPAASPKTSWAVHY